MPTVLAQFIKYERHAFYFFSFLSMVHSHPLMFCFSSQLSVSTSQFLKPPCSSTRIWAREGEERKFRWDRGRAGRAGAESCCEHWLLSAHLRLMESDTAGTLPQARTHTHTYKQHAPTHTYTMYLNSTHTDTHTRREDFSVSILIDDGST